MTRLTEDIILFAIQTFFNTDTGKKIRHGIENFILSDPQRKAKFEEARKQQKKETLLKKKSIPIIRKYMDEAKAWDKTTFKTKYEQAKTEEEKFAIKVLYNKLHLSNSSQDNTQNNTDK